MSTLELNRVGRRSSVVAAMALAGLVTGCATVQQPVQPDASQDVLSLHDDSLAWNAPMPPFRIAEGLYYVGASNVSAFIVRTPDGLILLDTGFAQTVPQILANLETLGLSVRDIRYILTSQAHYDHVGGVAEMKRVSGAKLVASAEDAALMARGGRGDFAFGDELYYPAVRADRIVADGDTVELGGVRLTANLTPGHTQGCTSWSMEVKEGGRPLSTLFICGTTAPGYQLVGNTAYPDIVADFRRSFDRLDRIGCDLFLAAHGQFFSLQEKRARLAAGASSNPFVDPQGCRDHLTAGRAAFEAKLAEQSAAVPR